MSRIKAAQPPPEVFKVTMASHCSLLQHGLPGSKCVRGHSAALCKVLIGALASLKPGCQRSWCTSMLTRPCRKRRRWGSQFTDSVPI